jgi:endonuclease-3
MYADADCALVHGSAYELLVATILSARCTDKVVNTVTPELFRRFPTPARLAKAQQAEVEQIVHPCGTFRNKAKNLRGAAKHLLEEHGGIVPDRMEELIELPGVARKTANVVLGTAYGIAAGIVVDTHVHRIANRLGFVRQDTPEKTERALLERIPKRRWIKFSHQLIHHGRERCISRKPRCDDCAMAQDCPAAEVG